MPHVGSVAERKSEMKIASSVRGLTPYTPGEQPNDSEIIKLNTNENPYPPSPKVAEALSKFDIASLRRYPDPVFTALRRRIAEIHGCKIENVFIGNGSDEVLSVAAKAFVQNDEAIGSFDPSYSLYKTLAAIRDVKFVSSYLNADYSWTPPITNKDGVEVALFLLTNPNAPTSLSFPKDKIKSFASSFKGVVIIDEAYADFADENMMDLAVGCGNENTIVMRTLSKSFSLAGLRLGYCVGPEDLIEAMYKVKDSYNIDMIAQAVALAALEDIEWMKANAQKVCATRRRLTDALRAHGWDVPESQSNFIFAKPANKPAQEIFNQLRERHIFVRYFPGASTGERLRISIGTDEETDKLLACLLELDR
jgi:histidinol-phosphate aminotransferase